MLPTATIEHSMSGRLRVRVPDRRGDVSYFRSAVERLSEHPEIAGLRANPMTGSILIQHETDLPSIREIATRRELFDLQEESAPLSYAVAPPRSVEVSTPGVAAVERSRATTIGLTSLAFYQAIRGNVIGPATENFWNAFGGLRLLNSSLIALGFCGLGILQLTRGRWAGSASSLLFYAFVLRQASASAPGKRPADLRDGNPENPSSRNRQRR
ncbi:hypothetical protein PYH37_000094 [Sinorhizobium numidicum]|uniref:HMA domain-containing protein n=1 Tax=Sinorhizobium numidicum TaxID=680248 RepID=A0ABY8CQ78_9HYPH|nr:hypothetical protein [Sinorhizobium numidicum]WEX74813.1 hypothetical protein PYH37_000094 [Sinorhizobium numidicum]WEX80806.1 hypothetical protein PYH38_000096 [Sinorhizobium numidicum]